MHIRIVFLYCDSLL